MPSDIEVIKAALEYITLKALLTVAGVNLTEIDKIKEQWTLSASRGACAFLRQPHRKNTSPCGIVRYTDFPVVRSDDFMRN